MNYHFYVGTYNSMTWCKGTPGEGISLAALDTETGKLSRLQCCSGFINPSGILISKDQKTAYILNEVQPLSDDAIGLLSVCHINKDHSLELLENISCAGRSPSYLTFLSAGNRKEICITNYRSQSIAAFSLNPDNSVKQLEELILHTGKSVHPKRQTEARPHCVITDPSGRWLCVADLGNDTVTVYEISDQHPFPERFCFHTEPGDGPRHMIFDRTGQTLYLICELGSCIYVFDFRPGTGEPVFRQRIASVDLLPGEINNGSDLHLSSDERFLLVSNRGKNTIGVFRRETDGTLSFHSSVFSGGKTPRSFSFDPSGQFIIVGNQDSDRITAMRFNEVSGTLSVSDVLDLPSPNKIVFFAE